MRPSPGIPCALFNFEGEHDAQLGRVSRRGKVEVCRREILALLPAVMPRFPPTPRLRRGRELKGTPEL